MGTEGKGLPPVRQFWTPTLADSTVPADPGEWGHPVTHRINRKTASPPNLCPRHNMSRSESCTPRGHASLQRILTPPRGTYWILCLPGPPSFPCPNPQQLSMCQAMLPGWGSGERALSAKGYSLHPSQLMSS